MTCAHSGIVSGDSKLLHPGIERRGCAKRNRPLRVDVPEWNTTEAGDADLLGDFAQHLVERPATTARIVRAFHALSEDDCPATVEHARKHQLLQHSVDTVDRLVDILQHQNGIAEIRREWSAA